MPKMELSLKDAEKELIRAAAEKERLPAATWAKSKLLLLAQDAVKL